MIFLIPVKVGGSPVTPRIEVEVVDGSPTLPFVDPAMIVGTVELKMSPAAELGNPAGSNTGEEEEMGELDEVVLAPDPGPLSLSSTLLALLVSWILP